MSDVLVRTRSFRPLARVAHRERPAVADALPAWRGVSHEKAFALSPALGLLLLLVANGRAAQIAAVTFGVTMTAMLGASALNHRAALGPRWEYRFRRADHTAINLFVAGTWTSVALVVLPGATRLVLIAAVWGAALAASIVTIAWLRMPGWLIAIIGLAAAWPAAYVVLFPLGSAAGTAAVALFLGGGVVYTVGAVAYALQRPNPHPAFGYHEVFHALVLGGAACHYLTLALFVLRLEA
jgi:hemolysin III